MQFFLRSFGLAADSILAELVHFAPNPPVDESLFETEINYK